jgi:hypothetical protein
VCADGILFHPFISLIMTNFPTSSIASVSGLPASAQVAQRLLLEQYRTLDTLTPELDAAFRQVFGALEAQQQVQTQLTRMIDSLVPNQGGAMYRQDINAFVTQGYTSAAGNSYFDVIRVSSTVVTKLDVGIGYAHSFCNGISIYSADGSKTLLKRRYYHNYRPSEDTVRAQMIELTCEYLLEQIEPGLRAAQATYCKELATSIIDQTTSVRQPEALQQIKLALASGG